VWGSDLADAALSLKSTNEIGPVVVTPKGIHLIRLLGRRERLRDVLEAAKSHIEGRLASDGGARSIDALVADLRNKTNVEFDEKARQSGRRRAREQAAIAFSLSTNDKR
jgi:hypothetical protein